MTPIGEHDDEDRTRGFRPPEPRGLGLRWIFLALAAVLVAVFVASKLMPSAAASKPAAAPAAHGPASNTR